MILLTFKHLRFFKDNDGACSEHTPKAPRPLLRNRGYFACFTLDKTANDAYLRRPYSKNKKARGNRAFLIYPNTFLKIKSICAV